METHICRNGPLFRWLTQVGASRCAKTGSPTSTSSSRTTCAGKPWSGWRGPATPRAAPESARGGASAAPDVELHPVRCLLLLVLLITPSLAREKTIHHPGTGLSFPPTIQSWTRVLVQEIQDPNDPQDPHRVIGYSSPDAKLTLYLYSARGSTGVDSPPFQVYWKNAKDAMAMVPFRQTKLKSEGPYQVPGGPTQGLRAVYALTGLLGGAPERSELIMLLWRGHLVKVRTTGATEQDTNSFLKVLQWSKGGN